ncbi:MAG: heat-inducible transcription repressor HrcA [Firmicutes bacterium]|nr:heat-inducible transcription repressor HrcA [Bacillota bacterium]
MLTSRKALILKAVVTEYIVHAEPVGSRTVTRRYNINLSPATVRNEMADLEEMGYLVQPHTSAGRIPTQKGYRFYVDNLMDDDELSPDIKEIVRKKYKYERMREIQDLIFQTCRLLSELTSYTSIVLGPRLRKSAFKKLQIMPLDDRRGLLVVMADTGFIKNKVIELPRSLPARELARIVAYLNHRLGGLTMEQISAELLREMRHDLYNHLTFLERALKLLEESLSEEERRIFLWGTSHILNQPEFKDVEKIKALLGLFEQHSLLASLLEDTIDCDRDVVVKIGSENALEEIKECSLVLSTYQFGQDIVGTLAVLGPTRMHYGRVIAATQFVASQLNKHLAADYFNLNIG